MRKYPIGWKTVKLEAVAEFFNGKPLEGRVTPDGNSSLITLDSVDIKGQLKNNHKKINADGDFLKAGDIVSVLSDIAHGYLLGLSAVIPADDSYVLNQRMGLLRTSSEIDPNYLRLFINFNQSYFRERGQGTSQRHIYKRDFYDFDFSYPPLTEQKAIAKVLSDIDELIENLKLQIAKTQNVKESICRPLVLSKTRLNGFTNNWVQRTLGDELGYEQPTKYLVNTTEHQETGNVPVLTAGKSFILGYSDDTEGVYTNTPTILFDDFTTDSKFVDFDFKVKSSACKMVKNINPKSNLRFFHTLMQYLEFRPYDHKRYWISEYSKLEILVPEPIEQNAIAAVVEDFENQIKLLKSELAKYECIKQGMAHDLLTGKVRLV